MFHQIRALLVELDRAERRQRRRPTLGVRLGVRLYERVTGQPCWTTHRPVDIRALDAQAALDAAGVQL